MTESGWTALRSRLVEIARRRVAAAEVEDVVQETLAIVHEKSGSATEPPALPWCCGVLRNVIGNHYQRRRTRDDAARDAAAGSGRINEATIAAGGLTPLEALERADLVRGLEESIRELEGTDPECARRMRAALGREHWRHETGRPVAPVAAAPSGAAAPVAAAPSAGSSTEFVRDFRCRQKLKRILLRRGLRA